MLDTLKNGALTLVGGLCLVLGVLLANSCARLQIADARLAAATAEVGRLTDAIEGQKKVASAVLAAENTGALAKQRALDEGRAHQEKDDVDDSKVVDGLRGDLQRVRAAGGLRKPAQGPGRGDGGGAQPGQGFAGADHRAGNRADAGGLLPAVASGTSAGDEDAYLADRINLAYASCRIDAYRLRDVLNAANSAADPVGHLIAALQVDQASGSAL